MYKVNSDKTYYIAVYESRNHALQMYQYLKNAHKGKFLIISTPCRIKAGCSYSIKFTSEEDIDLLIQESEKFNKKISGFYLIEKANGRSNYKKVVIT